MRRRQIPLVVLLTILHQASVNTADSIQMVDLDRLQAGEVLPAGKATYMGVLNDQVFSHASAGMSLERELNFRIGNGIFNRLWVSAPSSTQAADGLGPLYNARACQQCHIRDGRGHPPVNNTDDAVSLVLRLSIPPRTEEEQNLLAARRLAFIQEPVYGAQLQDFAIQGQRAEGRVHIDYHEFPVILDDGTEVNLRRPVYSVRDAAYGPLHAKAMLSPRVAPPMIGLGLLEAVNETDIMARSDPDDRDGDGISGKPNQVWSGRRQAVMLGRFGRKAGRPTIEDQVQDAFTTDIGISVPLHPAGWGECTAHQAECRRVPDGNSLQYGNVEADQTIMDLTVFYVRHLAVPARRGAESTEILAGKRLFYMSGCAACHTPTYSTSVMSGEPELSGQKIWPYTDLLLHDLGEGLSDQRPEGLADGREWRTAPLWGIGLTSRVNGHSFYLHDGRARNLLEAVLWHGGEAEAARDAVVRMTAGERANLFHFVESL